MFKKWLREPLVHFLLIGGALFLLYGLQNEGFDEQSKRIVFSKEDISRLVLRQEKTRQRPPTQVELKGPDRTTGSCAVIALITANFPLMVPYEKRLHMLQLKT